MKKTPFRATVGGADAYASPINSMPIGDIKNPGDHEANNLKTALTYDHKGTNLGINGDMGNISDE